MLYGNIIFIKKTGGDGSKYPVTEKSVKIGRSEECLIRIYNTQVALEHCQLIIGDNGQATLKDLSNQTFLNGNLLALKEATLCHGDVFKVGERLARWEYLPTSTYYKQIRSPTGRLVAVVMPQQRCFEGQPSGTSASFDQALKSTPVGGKRRYSERFASESASAVKMRKSNNSSVIKKSKGDLPKLLTGQYSLKTNKLLLPAAKIKNRKSTSGIISSRTPKVKSRKSTLPSWKVNSASTAISAEKETSLSTKSRGRSAKSSDSIEKILNLALDPQPEKLSVAKKRMRSSQKTIATLSEEIVKSVSSDVLKTPVKVVVDSPLKLGKSTKLTRSLSNSPSPKRPALISTPSSKPMRLIQSEKKQKVGFGKSSVCNRELNSVVLTPEKYKIGKVKKELATEKLKTPIFQTLNESGDMMDFKKGRQVSNLQKKSNSAKSTPLKKTSRKLEKNLGKVTPSSERKNLSKSFALLSRTSENLASARSPKASSVRISLRKTINLSKERVSSPRGVRRKLSPSISSAERAAKELKTSSPKKPDKNKKAALLVLGKASRKQLLAQNVKVLLKQKIVKKAIKQSTAATTEKIENGKKKLRTTVKGRPKKSPQNNIFKTKKKAKKSDSKKRNSSKSTEVPFQSKDEIGYRGENTLEGNDSKVSETLARSPKFINSFNEASESSQTIYSKETSSPYRNLEKATESFVFNSNRRCSKRLSSKNDLGRPDFVELSPTALGLMPKNVEVFKTPKQSKRRSSSLATPKIIKSVGIIKSASTSKIGTRKNVRFSSKDLSLNSEFYSPGEKSDFDLGAFKTPNISMDVFISPLGNKSTGSKKGMNESHRITFASEVNSELGLPFRSNSEPRKCIRKLLQSPQSQNRISSKEPLRASRLSSIMNRTQTTDSVTSENNLNNFNSEFNTTPKNSLSDTNGVLRLLRSSKNDSTDNKEVKKMLKPPRVQKSPKNDLFDVRGVKKLLGTPKVQRSPKNDLSDVRGVKKLMGTPKTQKSPKNDLSDVRGVKKLMGTPKAQRSPKNDLSDVRGVKKLLGTPKVQKSPKNDLSDVRGVKKLMGTPKVQKSPKNDLSDLRGVKKLLGTPKVQKSPKNDLSDLRGVKKLLGTPKVQKSPKNDLSDVRGVKKLLGTPKVQKSPKNDLNVSGVKELFRSPRVQKSPKNELLELSGIQQLFESPKHQRSSQNNTTDTHKNSFSELLEENLIKSFRNQKLDKDFTGFSESYQLGGDEVQDILNIAEMNQVPETRKNLSNVSKSQKSVARKSRVNDLRAVRGRRSICSTPKEIKNDLSFITGVHELFASYEASLIEESLMGVAELFSLAEEEGVSTPKGRTYGKRTASRAVKKVAKMESPGEKTNEKDENVKMRRSTRGILKKAEETAKTSVRVKKLKTDLKTESPDKRQTRRKAAEKSKPSKTLKSPAAVKRSERIKKGIKESVKTSQGRTKSESEIKTRKRKAAAEDIASPPPKLRRKRTTANVDKTTSESKTSSALSKKVNVRTTRKAPVKVKDEKGKTSLKVQKKASQTNAEQILKVQKKRSQSSSKKNLSQEDCSPVKTRSTKREAASPQNRTGKRKAPSESKTSGRKKLTPVIKKSTRRK